MPLLDTRMHSRPSSQQSIRQLADTCRQRYPHLHELINNAGAGFTQRQESVDGVEMTFAVNYLAPSC